jgi:CSLREA domain-containing protein
MDNVSASGRMGRDALRRVGALGLAVGLCVGSGSPRIVSAASPGLTLVVTSTVDAVDVSPGDGRCATAAGTCTLRAAVQEANAQPGPDTVQLPAGVYTLTMVDADLFGAAEDLSATGDLDIRDSLRLIGAGANSTFIEGVSAIVSVPPWGDLPFNDRVIDIFPPADVSLTGVTLRNGLVGGDGGGVRNLGGHLELNHAVVSGTVIPQHLFDSGFQTRGAGIFNDAGRQLTITDSTVSGANSPGFGGGASGVGGAVWNAGTVTITRSVISGSTNGGGGGLLNIGTATISHSDIAGGAHAVGGGISNAGPLTLVDSSIAGGSGSGGGIESSAGTVTIIRTRIHDSSAGPGEFALNGGGGIWVSGGTLMVADSLVNNNEEEDLSDELGGGGLLVTGAANATLTNVTFSGNTAPVGSAVRARGSGTVLLINSTVAANRGRPGRVSDVGAALMGAVTLRNTIVANNTAEVNAVPPTASIADANCHAHMISEGHNLESGNSCGLRGPGDLQNVSPVLGPLAGNGGTTATHALRIGSPAIDAGASAGCPNHDQRGVLRPRDGDFDGVAVCDIGAFEFQPLPDTRAPTSTAVVAPTPNSAGWNRANVQVTLTGRDETGGSGVRQLSFDGRGAQPIALTTLAVQSTVIPITAEGVTSLRFFATDRAGNREGPQHLTIRIDRTPPVVVFAGNQGTYTVDQTVNITCTATDPQASTGASGSGVASTTCTSVAGPAATFGSGAHTVSATAIDLAGNTGMGETTFTVR